MHHRSALTLLPALFAGAALAGVSTDFCKGSCTHMTDGSDNQAAATILIVRVTSQPLSFFLTRCCLSHIGRPVPPRLRPDERGQLGDPGLPPELV